MGKYLSNKYSQAPLDSAKKSTTDAIKTTSKRVIQKKAEATGDLIGNKIADKNTKKSPKELHSKTDENELEIPKQRYTSPKERQKIIDELRYNNIIMEYQKTINLLDNALNQPSKFRAKIWIEINHQSRGTYNINSDIKFKTTMLKFRYVIIAMHTYLLKEE